MSSNAAVKPGKVKHSYGMGTCTLATFSVGSVKRSDAKLWYSSALIALFGNATVLRREAKC